MFRHIVKSERMVKLHAVDLSTSFDVSSYAIKGEKRIGNSILRKVRYEKSKVVVPVKRCHILEVKALKDGSSLVTMHPPQLPLVDFVLGLERHCINEISKKRYEWIEDHAEEALNQSIKYHQTFGKVIQVRVSKSSLATEKQIVNCSLRLEGVLFTKNNSRFSLFWTIDDVEFVDDFKLEPIEIVVDERDGEEIAMPDIEEILTDLQDRIRCQLDSTVNVKEQATHKIEVLSNLLMKSCGVNDLEEIEAIVEELDAIGMT